MSDGSTAPGQPVTSGVDTRPHTDGMPIRRGSELLAQPAYNKDAAFTIAERRAYGLCGLLPCGVATIEQQVELELEHLHRKHDDLEKYIGLAALQDRNETLFYRLLIDHLDELAPIVYTPTVGEACSQFSHVVRRPRGLWITPDDIDRMPELLRNINRPGVRLIVATDNERILGLGDQGAGGMGIPVGKLALYTAGAGVHPSQVLPISLDVGTDNAKLLNDPLYAGYQHPRLRGEAYDRFIEAFVTAVQQAFPDAVLQWEDFKQHNAIRLLDRYRHRLTTFNDDIQGTAVVVMAGLLAALRLRQEPMSAQRLVMLGAGAAGIGIARLAEAIATEESGPQRDPRFAVVMLDSRGLVFEGREHIDDDKRHFALSQEDMRRFGFEPAARYDLEEVIRHVGPTILIGTTGTPGAFTETAIRQMAARTEVPIVLPLSNPTAKTEAHPADILAWSDGRAVVATGSPFEPVQINGQRRLIGQANNVFVFPGIGLGAIVARASEVTDGMFLVAAKTMASMISEDLLEQGALYPLLSELRHISRAIAIAVAAEAQASGVARAALDDIPAAVDAAMWDPNYEPLPVPAR